MRLRPQHSLTLAQQTAAREFLDLRGYEPRGPFAVLLRSPELLTRVRALGDYLRFSSTVAPALRELAILVVARHCGQRYEWIAHASLAESHGVSAATIETIRSGCVPDDLALDANAVYRFAAEMCAASRVSDRTFEEALRAIGERATIDLAALVGYYVMIAMILDLGQDNGSLESVDSPPTVRSAVIGESGFHDDTSES